MKFLAIILAVLGMSIAETTEAHAVTEIGAPPMECSQGNGLFRVYENLVFILEDCTTFAEEITPPDTLVMLMNPRPYAFQVMEECDHMGGRYEYVSFLHVCWNVDY